MGNENTKLCENCRDGLIGSALGMTLRDYFAAKAMAALIAEPVSEGRTSTVARWANQVQGHTQMSGQDIVAHVAYMMADAMLRAREQQPRESVNAELLEASKEAEAALAELQREQWVPISERLPEKEQYPVLVAHRSGAVRMVFGIEPFIDGDWMGYYEPALQGRFLRGITHWMPLPPAPQPEESP